MSLRRYQAIKRYLHIAPSLLGDTWEPESIEEELGTSPEHLEAMWWIRI